jgi:hypothetical protein
MPAMTILAMFFTAAVAQTVTEKTAHSGEVYVEMGAADMAVHRNSQSTMMRRQSDAMSQASLADIRKHSGYGDEDPDEPAPLTNNTAYHHKLMESNPVIVCSFERHGESQVVCNGEACGGVPDIDVCAVNGIVSGHPAQRDGLVPFNTKQRSMLFSQANGGVVTIPDDHLLTSSTTGFPNRTITLFFHIPPLSGNESEPKIIYCQGDANLGGVSIYHKETADGKQFVHMFAWDHENEHGNSEFGTVDVAPEGIRCPELNENGGTYWVAFSFRQHNGKHVVYDGRLWKHGWSDAKHCGTADGKLNVTLPNDAKIPRTGHEEGEIKLGGITKSCRASATEALVAGTSGYHCNCTLDEVAIYNRALSDDELWKVSGHLCGADGLMKEICDNRASKAAQDAADSNPLAGVGL